MNVVTGNTHLELHNILQTHYSNCVIISKKTSIPKFNFIQGANKKVVVVITGNSKGGGRSQRSENL